MEGFQSNVDAASRDYVIEPRLRKTSHNSRHAVRVLILVSFAEYQTVRGVNGPLVILENVKNPM